MTDKLVRYLVKEEDWRWFEEPEQWDSGWVGL